MKYYVIAGEASGDLHGANLLHQLKKQDAKASFRCWGGDLMKAEGAELVKHYRDLAFMGFLEVIKNLKTILSNIDFCKKDILDYAPDVLVLIDYPGFNLRIAEFAKQQGIKVVYYISPQVWAWKQSRVKKIKRDVDLMLVILPFEKDFYKKFGMDVKFVGHPLLDAIAKFKLPENAGQVQLNLPNDKPLIALLPGSRKQEIDVKLPIMLSVVDSFPEYRFVIAGAPGQTAEVYKEHIGSKDINLIFGETYPLLNAAHAALVTSGTATLETALFKVPEVVCYKGSYVSYVIAKQLVKIKFISLVNLIMDRMVVTELIQEELNKKNVEAELRKILSGAGREKMMQDYNELERVLGGPGASEQAAKAIVEMMK